MRLAAAYQFTPNVPAAPTGLTFAPVTATSIQLNWTDNATNEFGYVIYRSLDGTNFSFLTQLAAGSTLFNDTGLAPEHNLLLSSPCRFGRRTERRAGGQSGDLSRREISLPRQRATGDAPATWVGGVVPTAGDNVTIASPHTVTINSSNAFSVTVQNGGILEFEAITATNFNGRHVCHDQFRGHLPNPTATGTVTTHVLSVGTNLTNNGTLDFSTNADTAGAGITFTGAANNTFGGTGGTTDVRGITINKGTSNANILELLLSNFTVRGVNTDVAGYLTLTNGTFKISGTFTMANRTFIGPTYTIPATGGIWLNNPNYTVSPTASGTATNNNGLFRMTSGDV